MHRRPLNLPAILLVALPLFAVLASAGAAAVAMLRGDATFPDQYHWEGLKLDQDFARSRRAADLHVTASLQAPAVTGACRVVLHLDGPLPPAITLALVHGSDPKLDRYLRLTLRGRAYEAPCEPLSTGRWHIEIGDAAGTWSLRQESSGALANVQIPTDAPER
jgi:hypothetical protein